MSDKKLFTLYCSAMAAYMLGGYWLMHWEHMQQDFMRIASVGLVLLGLLTCRYVAMQLHHTLADGIALVQLLIGVITMIVAHVFLEANALFFLGLMLLLCGFATGARDRQGFH